MRRSQHWAALATAIVSLVSVAPADVGAQQRQQRGPGATSRDSTWVPGTYGFGGATDPGSTPTGTTADPPPPTPPRTAAVWTWGPTAGERHAVNITGWLANSANFWSDWIQTQYCTGDECPYPSRSCYGNYEMDPGMVRPLYMVGAPYNSPVTTVCHYEMRGTGGRDFPFPIPRPPGTPAVGWDGIWKNPDGTRWPGN